MKCILSVLTSSTKCSLFYHQGVYKCIKTDLQALNLSGTYRHKTGTRTPSCTTPRELTIYTYRDNK